MNMSLFIRSEFLKIGDYAIIVMVADHSMTVIMTVISHILLPSR